MFDYCNVCGTTDVNLMETRDGKKLCEPCADDEGFCEVCGTVRLAGQTADEQLHYEEECFK